MAERTQVHIYKAETEADIDIEKEESVPILTPGHTEGNKEG